MTPAPLFLLASLLAVFPLVAQEAPSPPPLPDPRLAPPGTFVAECEMITIPRKLVPIIVPELNDETKAGAAVQKLHAMIARGEATLTGHLSARGLFGTKIQAESILEVKSSTEFEPPLVPAVAPLPAGFDLLKYWPHVGITPMAFDTRNVGQTMELEVWRAADPRVLHVSCVPQHVRSEKAIMIDTGQTAMGEHLYVPQPCFSNFCTQFNTIFLSGIPKLVGVHRLAEAEGVYEVAIMTLRTAPPRIAAGKAPPFVPGSDILPEPDPLPWSGYAELRMVAIPLAEAVRLLPQLRARATFAKAAQRVEALLANGEAELADWLHVPLQEEERATAESTVEIRYPTDWSPIGCFPPPPPSPFVSSILERSSAASGSSRVPGTQITPYLEPSFEHFDVPSAFDTRNTGASLELEPQVNAGGLEISLSACVVRFEGLSRTIAGRPGPPTWRGYPQPLFRMYKVQTNFPIDDGGGALIGSFTLPAPKPRMLLFLFHAAQTKPPEIP